MNERTLFPISLNHEAPRTHGVPERYHVETPPQTALLTVAALFFHPVGKLVDERGRVTRLLGNEQTQTTGYLALWAAGARVKLTAEDWAHMEKLVGAYSDQLYFGDFGHMPEAHILSKFARREAFRRAEAENLTGTNAAGAASQDGMAEVDFNAGRGYGELGNGLPHDFDRTASEHERLVTYAALFAHRRMGPSNRRVQAIVWLALYAAGAEVSLTGKDFSHLERLVRRYLGEMRANGVPVNGDRAHFILTRARRRAYKDGVLGRRAA